MLKKIDNLPNNIIGIQAEGKVTSNDYEIVLIPILEEAHKKGEKVKFLYHIGSDCTGFTLAAAWDDMKVGIKYFNLFEKCAIVSDIHWVENLVNVFRFMVPYPIRIFHNSDMNSAIEWLS